MRFNPDNISPELHRMLNKVGRLDLLKGFEIDDAVLAHHIKDAHTQHSEKHLTERFAIGVSAALFDARAPHNQKPTEEVTYRTLYVRLEELIASISDVQKHWDAVSKSPWVKGHYTEIIQAVGVASLLAIALREWLR